MIVLLYLLGLISSSFGQLISPGRCPEQKPVDNYNETRFLGRWYEEWRTNNSFQPDFQCSEEFFYKSEAGYIIARVSSILPTAGARLTFNGALIPNDDCELYTYHLTFESYSTDPGIDVLITDADWDSWVVMYGCVPHGHLKYEYIWIFVKDPDTCDVEAISEAVNKLGICFDDLMRINRDHCPSTRNGDAPEF